MTTYKYKDIVNKAKQIKLSVESTYDFSVTPRWCYYICKSLLSPGKDFKGISISEASKPNGDHISRTVKKADYIDMCKRVVTYVEKNHKMPNYVTYKTYKVNIRLFTYIVAYLLVHYVSDRKLKSNVSINSKYFVKPTEDKNTVYEYFVKVFGKISCIDDALEKIQGRGYGYYYDDQYSNRQSIDRIKNRQGVNCTDSSQVFYNIGKALGYEVRAVHVLCQGGDGHVRLQFKHSKNTGGQWINRDPAAVLDGECIECIWCSNGTILAYDPKWFLDNCSR